MKTVDHDKVDLPLGAGILSANGIAMDGIMDLDYFQVSPRIKVRVGNFIKISGGPRYERKLMGGMRGVWLVRKIYEDNGEIFLEVNKKSGHVIESSFNLIRVTGEEKPSKVLDSIINIPHKIKLIKKMGNIND